MLYYINAALFLVASTGLVASGVYAIWAASTDKQHRPETRISLALVGIFMLLAAALHIGRGPLMPKYALYVGAFTMFGLAMEFAQDG